MLPVVGIDLGTTKSVIGIWQGGRCHIIADNAGYQSIPSLVVVTADERILPGRQAQKHPDRYRSKNVTISSIKRLMGRKGETGWGWLSKEEYIPENPLTKLPLPKVPQSLIKTLTVDQFKRLLAKVDRHTSLGAKYYCILLFLLDTGVRISELVNIKMADIDLVNCLVRVVGKGRRERLLPFHRHTRRELQHYIKVFRPELFYYDSCYLFPGPDRDHISVNSVQQFIRRPAIKAGLRGMKCSPKLFRHSFAITFIAKGGTDFALKEILGHTSLQPTLKYTHLQPRDLQRQHDRFTPVEDLFPGEH